MLMTNKFAHKFVWHTNLYKQIHIKWIHITEFVYVNLLASSAALFFDVLGTCLIWPAPILNTKLWRWKQRSHACSVREGRQLMRLGIYGGILTGKTWLADANYLGQNDHLLKLHTLINFVGTRHLVLIPITVFNNNRCTEESTLTLRPCCKTWVKPINVFVAKGHYCFDRVVWTWDNVTIRVNTHTEHQLQSCELITQCAAHYPQFDPVTMHRLYT